MITLTARINLLSTGGAGTISSASCNKNGINISAGISDVLGQKGVVGNPFIIGLSKLGSGDYYSGGEDYFIGSVFADDDGSFGNNSYTITITGNSISAFTICFDEQHGRFPHSIKVDNVEYTDDDPNYTISVEAADSHTIVIDNWNTANYPLVISGIFVELSIDLDYNQITAISREMRERSDISMPSWGILSSGGSLDFNDYDGEFLDYIEQNILKSGVEVTINLNNTLGGKTQSGEWVISEQIAKYYIDDVDYDVNNKIVSLSIKDNVEKLQNTKFDFSDFECNPLHYSSKTFPELYEMIRDQVEDNGVEMMQFSSLGSNEKTHLQGMTMTVPLIFEDESIWSCIEKFGVATGGHFYINSNGVLIYRYNGGI